MPAKKINALTDEILLTSPRKTKLYKLFDGDGLFIEKPATGNMRWRFRYTFQGRDKKLSVGIYPETSIMDARMKADQLRALIKDGIDPSTERRVIRMEQVEKTTGEYCKLKDVMSIVRGVRDDIRNMLNE